jgi:hypothetical protein
MQVKKDQCFEILLTITEIQWTTGSGYVKPLKNHQVSWKNQQYGPLFELFNCTSTEHQKQKISRVFDSSENRS